MSQICEVTGKRPLSGQHVSHANNKTKRKFNPNLHVRQYCLPNSQIKVKLKLSTKGIRMIDRLGILAVLTRIQHPVLKVLNKRKDKDG